MSVFGSRSLLTNQDRHRLSPGATMRSPLGIGRPRLGRHDPRGPALASWIDRRLRFASYERRGRRMRGGLRGTGRSDNIGA